MSSFVQRSLSPGAAAYIRDYMARAGVPLKAAGGGFFISGTPSHLAMLTELAMADKMQEEGKK